MSIFVGAGGRSDDFSRLWEDENEDGRELARAASPPDKRPSPQLRLEAARQHYEKLNLDPDVPASFTLAEDMQEFTSLGMYVLARMLMSRVSKRRLSPDEGLLADLCMRFEKEEPPWASTESRMSIYCKHGLWPFFDGTLSLPNKREDWIALGETMWRTFGASPLAEAGMEEHAYLFNFLYWFENGTSTSGFQRIRPWHQSYSRWVPQAELLRALQECYDYHYPGGVFHLEAEKRAAAEKVAFQTSAAAEVRARREKEEAEKAAKKAEGVKRARLAREQGRLSSAAAEESRRRALDELAAARRLAAAPAPAPAATLEEAVAALTIASPQPPARQTREKNSTLIDTTISECESVIRYFKTHGSDVAKATAFLDDARRTLRQCTAPDAGGKDRDCTPHQVDMLTKAVRKLGALVDSMSRGEPLRKAAAYAPRPAPPKPPPPRPYAPPDPHEYRPLRGEYDPPPRQTDFPIHWPF